MHARFALRQLNHALHVLQIPLRQISTHLTSPRFAALTKSRSQCRYFATQQLFEEQPYLAALDKVSKLQKLVFSDTPVAPAVAVHSYSTIHKLKGQFKDGSFNTRSLEVALLNIIGRTFPSIISQSMSGCYTECNTTETAEIIKKQLNSPTYSAAPDLTLAFYRFSSLDPNSVVGSDLLKLLADALRAAPPLSHFDIATILFSLHRVDPTIPGVDEVVYQVLRHLRECNEVFPPRMVAMMLFGCRGLSVDKTFTRKLFVILKQKLYDLKLGMAGCDVVMSFLGLQSSGSHFLETRGVLSVLMSRMQYPHPDSHIDVSLLPGLVIGLQKMSSEHGWVRSAIAAVAGRMDASMKRHVYTDHDHVPTALLAEMFSSMRHFNSKHEEAILLISTALKLSRAFATSAFSAEDVSHMVLGMQSMQLIEDTKPLIEYISSHVDAIERFSLPQLGRCLHGLQRMSSDEQCVVVLLNKLLQRTSLHSYDGTVHLSTLTRMIHGLMMMDYNHIPQLEEHMEALVAAAMRVTGAYVTQIKQKVTPQETVDNINSLRQVLLLYSMVHDNLHTPIALKEKLIVLEQSLKRAQSSTKKAPATSKTENALVKMFETRFHIISKAQNPPPSYALAKHKLLFGFDADIFFSEIFPNRKSGRIVNIEIDGPHHIYAHRKRFGMLRDKYLRDIHGVEIIRIPIPKHRDWGEKEMKDMVHQKLRECGIISEIVDSGSSSSKSSQRSTKK